MCALDEPVHEITALQRVLERQRHVLDSWDPASAPGLLLQQLHYEADACDENEVGTAAADVLVRHQLPHLQIIWSAGEKTSPLLRHTIVTGSDARPVAVTADGRRAVVGSEQGTVIVWELATGQIQHRLTGHRRAIRHLCVSADGMRIITGSDDGTVRVWRPGDGSGRVLADYRFPLGTVTTTADGHHIAVAGRWGGIDVYNTTIGQLVAELPGNLAGRPRPLLRW